MTVEEMARARDNQLRKHRARRAAIARANGHPYGFVDVTPIRRHVRSLCRIGWSQMTIALLHGDCTGSQVRQIAIGKTERAHVRMESLLAIPRSYRVPPSLPDESKVPAAGAVRRVQSLLALGWTHEQIMELTDGYHTGRLLSSRKGPPLSISAANWRKVDRAFRALSARRGPNTRAAGMARGLGYVPPAAWDDIDDPLERPKGAAA